MKKSILFPASILLLIVTVLAGCQTSAEKVENAEDKVLEAKKDLAVSERNLYEAKLDTITNYEQFKIEAQKIIDAQEKNISEFKANLVSGKKDINAEYEKKLATLENKNNELKRKLADYKDDGKDKWVSFKNEFNHDVNQLGKAFQDLTVDNSK